MFGMGMLAVAVTAVLLTPVARATEPATDPVADPATDPTQTTCVVEGPEILEASLQPCGTSTPGAPRTPIAIRTRITGPQAIRVRWQEPAGRKARLYSVYAFAGTKGTLVCKVKRLRCTASALDVDQQYTFYVVASNRSGSSAAAASAGIYLPADASPDGFR